MHWRSFILQAILTACCAWAVGCGGSSEPAKTAEADELAQFLESKTTKELKFIHFDVLETNSAEFPYEARVTVERTRNGVKSRLFARCEYRGGKWEFAKGSDPELVPK
jgi:hypothetical protein